ncbi:hypothetical protein BGX29_002003 [Mortierella sp. GBA35]|nr:hypothetical protein BGX29_002003 [Mortierella sp. GBA35]
MKIPSSVLPVVALMVATAVSAQQEPIDASNEVVVEPMNGESISFVEVGHDRLIPVTDSELDAIEQGEWPADKPVQEFDLEAAPVGTAVVLSRAEILSILHTHNEYRKHHGSPPVSWNTVAAKFGNDWPTSCEFKHSGGKYGENIAYGYKDFPTMIKAWYDEVSKYNFQLSGRIKGTGHFTQVVWKSTKMIGCAKRVCPNWTIYICDYDPPGNIINPGNTLFKANVLPLVN